MKFKTLFSSPIHLAHHLWEQVLEPGDWAIDATCGNGNDTLKLAQLLKGNVIGLDIQKQAIENTRCLLEKNGYPGMQLIQQSHTQFPIPDNLKLIVYNLGYLPGAGSKHLTTLTSTTLESIKTSLVVTKSGGAISIICYPGHPEGLIEQTALFDLAKTLNPLDYEVCIHNWPNRFQSPSLLFIKKN